MGDLEAGMAGMALEHGRVAGEKERMVKRNLFPAFSDELDSGYGKIL